MAWKKGQSGNPNGTPKDYKFIATLQRAIAQDNAKRLRAAAEQLLTLAAEGEPWAVKELADRLDGRPVQQIAGTGENGEILLQAIERIIVDPLQAPSDPPRIERVIN